MSPQTFEDPSTNEEVLEDDDDEGFISFDSSKYNFHRGSSEIPCSPICLIWN